MPEVAEAKVCLALVWHMHQPHYENPQTGQFQLPWVRLHGTKDYFDMAAAVEPFSRVRVTINVVPSLIEQLDDYVTGRKSDHYFELSRRGPAGLDPAERRFVEENFFSANQTTMIGRYPRYAELHRRHKNRKAGGGLLFSDAELRDLIVLFNLSWIDPTLMSTPGLEALADKGRNFTEEDKRLVLDRQLEILRGIVPLYRRLSAAGKIELSTSPVFHPILPLLLDSDCAREAMPDVRLPSVHIQFPEDFDAQVLGALERHQAVFGSRPAGMWPPEGGVSDAAVRRLGGLGLRWVASDEEVLAHSRLARGAPNPCQAYRVGSGGEEVAIIFRNKRISDLIGFNYQNWDPKEAARDFAAQVLAATGEGRRHAGKDAANPAAHETASGGAPPLVAVILDGENCWEYYPEDGVPFLRELYGLLDQHPQIEMVTVSEYLERHPPVERIERLFAGSWIQHNFAIWIGHPEDNAAWELLAQARAMIATAARDRAPGDPAVEAARRHLHIAEGSDWFWWFGDDHWSPHVHVFDQLFRAHLIAAYEAIGEPPPSELHAAIKGRFGRPRSDEQVPVRFIRPRIDGLVSHFYEWKLAGRVEAGQGGGAMHPSECELRSLHYGFDPSHLFVRVDLAEGFLAKRSAGNVLVIEITRPKRARIEIDLERSPGAERPVRVLRFDVGAFHPIPSAAVCAVDRVVEAAIPFADLEARDGDTVELAVVRVERGRTVEVLPPRLPIVFRAPGSDFEANMWSAS